jgi:hypothetical protein
MEQSKFARANSKSETVADVVSLTARRAKKSSAAIVQALKIVQAAEAAMGIGGWTPADELISGSNELQVKTGAGNLDLVREVSEQERIAKFAQRMFAITNNTGYNLALSAQ